jgi:hypothetical protein
LAWTPTRGLTPVPPSIVMLAFVVSAGGLAPTGAVGWDSADTASVAFVAVTRTRTEAPTSASVRTYFAWASPTIGRQSPPSAEQRSQV